VTRSSQRSFPSSTSMPNDAAVIAFVVEPIAKRVCVSTAAGRPSSRTPYPLAKTIRPSFTTAIASPGTFQSVTAFAV